VSFRADAASVDGMKRISFNLHYSAIINNACDDAASSWTLKADVWDPTLIHVKVVVKLSLKQVPLQPQKNISWNINDRSYCGRRAGGPNDPEEISTVNLYRWKPLPSVRMD
jgi:hypothetical protein